MFDIAGEIIWILGFGGWDIYSAMSGVGRRFPEQLRRFDVGHFNPRDRYLAGNTLDEK